MWRFLRAAAALAVAAMLAACADDPADSLNSDTPQARFAAASAAEQVMPGDVIVATAPGANVEEVAAAHGLSVAERGYRDAFFVLRGAVGSEHANAAALRKDARVRYAEPNYLRQPTTIKTELWAFYNPGGLNMTFTRGRNAGQPIGSGYTSIADADEDNIEGYAAALSPTDVVIGSIDTGVDFNHSEFTGRLVAGQNFIKPGSQPIDDDGHGTHTTGTMAGSTVGVTGVAGVAANVKVYVQKVCGKRGCPTSAIVSAIRAAADEGVVAMNLSLGGPGESTAESQAIAYAVDTVGTVVIASAGNGGTGALDCPACDTRSISVAATTWRDEFAPYSNWGTGLSIAAPGGSCYSNTTPLGCIYSAYKGGGYAWLQGTSMAAPQVTGTAAVVASVTGLRGTALRDRILGSVDHPAVDAAKYGTAGRLNTYRAVTGHTLPSPQ